jgi:hypothetical protein
MAPQNKRQNAAKAPVVAKKAKVEKTEVAPEDPVVAQLTPIVDELAASGLPASCSNLLRVALPYCFRGDAEERHDYQRQLLDLTSSLLKGDEDEKRKSLQTAEDEVSRIQTDMETSKGNQEAATNLAKAKDDELQKKTVEVKQINEEVEAAKQAVDLEQKKKETFLVEKSAIIAAPEAFQNVLAELWEPLKSSAFPSREYRKRDKAIVQLVEKLKPLELEECLLDAVAAALKMRQDKRCEFAETVFQFIVGAFERYKSSLAERVDATSSQEQEWEKVVAEATSKCNEIQVKLTELDKEHEHLQNDWAELQTSADEAAKDVKEKEEDLKAAQLEVEDKRSDLNYALALLEVFAKMQEPAKATIVEAEAPPVVPEPAAPDMEVEASKQAASLEQAESTDVAVVA